MEWKEIETKLKALPNVVDVHDLHVWNLSSQSVALTCHIRVSDHVIYDVTLLFVVQAHQPQSVLLAAHRICKEFEIEHTTIQVSDASSPHLCPSEACTSGKHHQICVSQSK
jgi:cobalt-zinc-cadmium efflux system protein